MKSNTPHSATMPKKRTNTLIQARYFQWRLYKRPGGAWYADGRSKQANGGRHSLGTTDKNEAAKLVHDLDLTIAVKQGLASKNLLTHMNRQPLPLAEGRMLYEQHLKRPRIAGGAKDSTLKRYQSRFNKFLKVCLHAKIGTWDEVDRSVIDIYGKFLCTTKVRGRNYAEKTIYDELVFVLSVHKWLREEKHIQDAEPIIYHLKKPECQRAHCYSPDEFESLVQYCWERPDLIWLGNVFFALGHTGLRIGELANLKWKNIDSTMNWIHLIDESARHSTLKNAVTTKSGKSRSLPIQEGLGKLLLGLPRNSEHVFLDEKQQSLKPAKIRHLIKKAVIEPLLKERPSFKKDPRFATARLHSFRHYFISMCARERDISIMTLMDWVGHQNSEMIRYYFHQNNPESLRQINKITFMKPTGKQPAGLPSQVAQRKGVAKHSTDKPAKRKTG